MNFEEVRLTEFYEGFDSSTEGTLIVDAQDGKLTMLDGKTLASMSFQMSEFCLPLAGPLGCCLSLHRAALSDSILTKIVLEAKENDCMATIHAVLTNCKFGDPEVRVLSAEDFRVDVATKADDEIVEIEERTSNGHRNRIVDGRTAFDEWGPEGPSQADVELQSRPTAGARRVVPKVNGIKTYNGNRDNSFRGPSGLYVTSRGSVVGTGARNNFSVKSKSQNGQRPASVNTPSTPTRLPFGGFLGGSNANRASQRPSTLSNNARVDRVDQMIASLNNKTSEEPPTELGESRAQKRMNARTIGSALADILTSGLPPTPKREKNEEKSRNKMENAKENWKIETEIPHVIKRMTTMDSSCQTDPIDLCVGCSDKIKL